MVSGLIRLQSRDGLSALTRSIINLSESHVAELSLRRFVHRLPSMKTLAT